MALTGHLAKFKQPCQRYFAARWIKMSSECFYLSAHLSVLLCCLPGSGTLCASWQCLEVPRGPPPSLAVQFVGTGASLSGMDVELVGSRYRMSLVKKRFATGDYVNTLCGLLVGFIYTSNTHNLSLSVVETGTYFRPVIGPYWTDSNTCWIHFLFVSDREVHGGLHLVNRVKARQILKHTVASGPENLSARR